jgi:hypothetical protein
MNLEAAFSQRQAREKPLFLGIWEMGSLFCIISWCLYTGPEPNYGEGYHFAIVWCM